MKKTLKELSLLGGIYHVVSIPFGVFYGFFILDIISLALPVVFLVFTFRILFKKSPLFLRKTETRFPIFSSYLIAAGWLSYVGEITGYIILALFSNDAEKIKHWTIFTGKIIFVLFVLSILVQSFILYKNRKKGKEGRILSALKKLCEEDKKR